MNILQKPLRRLKSNALELCDRRTPETVQLQLWILLLVSAWLIFNIDTGYTHLEKDEFVSVLGAVVPASTFDNEVLFRVFQTGFLVSAACWAFRVGSPISCWTSVLFYTLAVSFYWENLPWFRHKYVLPNWMLLAFALWYHVARDEIRLAVNEKRFWQTRLAPGWVTFLSLLLIGGFYSLSGIAKIRACGHAWGDGISLQIWLLELNRGATQVADLVVGHPLRACLLQSGTLIIELFAVMIAFSKTYRVVIGLGLLLMHAGVALTFGINFNSNIILLLAFLPTWDLSGVTLQAQRLLPRLRTITQL